MAFWRNLLIFRLGKLAHFSHFMEKNSFQGESENELFSTPDHKDKEKTKKNMIKMKIRGPI